MYKIRYKIINTQMIKDTRLKSPIKVLNKIHKQWYNNIASLHFVSITYNSFITYPFWVAGHNKLQDTFNQNWYNFRI